MGPAPGEPDQDAQPELRSALDSDGELLCRIAERDHAAFQILYRRYVRPVYGLALRRLCDREGAEDATQQAFAAIWRSAATYAPDRGGGVRWLFKVAENAIVEPPEAASRAPGPESADEDGWPTFRVHAAVAELPEQERVPLELVYWGGHRESEVAEQLGLPPGTVETRIRSALVRLAMRLQGLR